MNQNGVAAPLTTGAPFRGRSDGGRNNLLPPNLLLPLSVRSPLLRVSVVNRSDPSELCSRVVGKFTQKLP